MKKILILQGVIHEYRKPLFNKLAETYDISVCHSGKKMSSPEDHFHEIIIPEKKIGPFYWQLGISKLIAQHRYDSVIMMFDLRRLHSALISYFSRKTKIILWGPDASKRPILNALKMISMKKNPTIFYSDSVYQKFSKQTRQNWFVANNTFHIDNRIPCYLHPNKNKLLFVGRLFKRKELNILIDSFSKILPNISSEITLVIIGDGPEKENLLKLTEKLNLSNNIQFLGKETDTNKLEKYYQEAIASVSFGQAGLSVLQSMGYGVPFVTKNTAITGGEKINIQHNVNGIICKDTSEDLQKYLTKLCQDIDYARTLGKNAFEHYSRECTLENMVNSFIQAIEA